METGKRAHVQCCLTEHRTQQLVACTGIPMNFESLQFLSSTLPETAREDKMQVKMSQAFKLLKNFK